MEIRPSELYPEVGCEQALIGSEVPADKSRHGNTIPPLTPFPPYSTGASFSTRNSIGIEGGGRKPAPMEQYQQFGRGSRGLQNADENLW